MSSLIDLNNFKEKCRYCNGAGIVKYSNDEVGTICSCCRGKGYCVIDKDNIISISRAIDISNEEVYRLKTIHNMIRTIYPYNRIPLLKGINYIAFANEGILGTARQWYVGDYEDGKVITYEEYLNGKYPLPDELSLCPDILGSYPFDVNKSCQLSCTNEQRQECWNKFYGCCNLKEEKQEVVSKYVKDLKPRKTF